MYLTSIQFGKPRRGAEADFVGLIVDYLGALVNNDQIASTWILKDHEPPHTAFVSIPRASALADRHHSPWGRQMLRAVLKAGASSPRVVAVERPPLRSPSWRQAKTLFLYTSWLDSEPPLRAVDFAEPIPLYTTPLPSREREYVIGWADQFREHDKIWIATGDLEIPAYKQLVEPTSGLSEFGLECRAQIEAACGKPTYYYLPRYFAYLEGEHSRRCPSCGKAWAVRRTEATHRRARFHFRCRRCRLVSHRGVDVDGRLAKIGDFRSNASRRKSLKRR